MPTPIRPPGRQREIFELLGSYDPEQGLMQLLERVNWTGITPLHVYLATLNRLPETLDQGIAGSDYSAIAHVYAALHSREFQSSIVTNALNAYPEKRRLLFVHVPKCAGSDLIENIGPRYPSLFEDMGKIQWIDTDSLLLLLRQFVIRACQSDTILVSGHNTLKWYIANKLYRNGDRLFSVVRLPQEMVLSSVNYVLERFRTDPTCSEPDTREWAELLGFSSFDADMSNDGLLKLGLKILEEPKIVPPNNICAFLGDGTAASAIELMGRCNIELTDTKHYRRWLKISWGIDSGSRHNASRPILRMVDLDRSHLRYISDLWEEDIQLHDLILRNIEKRSDGRTYGSELL